MLLPIACLRPNSVAQTPLPARVASSYLGFYRVLKPRRSRFSTGTIRSAKAIEPDPGISNTIKTPSDHGPRIRFGDEKKPKTSEQQWPRYIPQKNVLDLRAFTYRFKNAMLKDAASNVDVAVRGRVWSIRKAGTKLAFIDIMQDGVSMQCVMKFNSLQDLTARSGAFKEFVKNLDRGDIISFRGAPYRTPSNELSVLATELPTLLSKCTLPLPEKISNQETKSRNRHLHMLLDRRPAQILHLRSEILKFLRNVLLQDGFVDVQTPILADTAGGAVARPFTTSATEFEHKELSLRIAPELWLKRLIIGGLERVFEIGPSFRNEGIDMNHNPEFWTCEFYKTYADLNELIRMTENMFSRLSQGVQAVLRFSAPDLSGPQADFSPPYRQLDFITAIEQSMRCRLPDLTSPSAFKEVVAILRRSGVTLPSNPTLPRLLDKLSSTHLEPQCKEPTWIVNHPECLSPLSKSFTQLGNGQRVAARAELFVNGQELVNTYEEENSPIEQRRKFEAQLLYRDPEDASHKVDEAYLQALASGMPPTGGWGCGIDRLCMLFAGTPRIADVLSFGTLRHVAGRSQENRLQSESKQSQEPSSNEVQHRRQEGLIETPAFPNHSTFDDDRY